MPEGLLTVCARLPTPPPKYKAVELRMWRKYAVRVAIELVDEDIKLLERIEKYAARFNYAENDVTDLIRNNKMFAATFAKAPNKTTLHEKMAAKWLKKELVLNDSISLPSSGRNAFYIKNDGVIEKNDARKITKSLDFQWQVGDITFYAMHKYTHEQGGNQDNQFDEMKATLNAFQNVTNINQVLIVIVDGQYYNQEKMRELDVLTRKIDGQPKSFAVHIEDVPQIVAQYR